MHVAYKSYVMYIHTYTHYKLYRTFVAVPLLGAYTLKHRDSWLFFLWQASMCTNTCEGLIPLKANQCISISFLNVVLGTKTDFRLGLVDQLQIKIAHSVKLKCILCSVFYVLHNHASPTMSKVSSDMDFPTVYLPACQISPKGLHLNFQTCHAPNGIWYLFSPTCSVFQSLYLSRSLLSTPENLLLSLSI